MIVVHGMFDSDMTPNGTSLEVCGPIVWDADGRRSDEILVLAVVVIQWTANGLITGSARPASNFARDGGDKWEDVFVTGNGNWVRHEPVRAIAVIAVHIPAETPEWIIEVWDEEPTLG
jgi:hypothetical protein